MTILAIPHSPSAFITELINSVLLINSNIFFQSANRVISWFGFLEPNQKEKKGTFYCFVCLQLESSLES